MPINVRNRFGEIEILSKINPKMRKSKKISPKNELNNICPTSGDKSRERIRTAPTEKISIKITEKKK